MSSEWIIDAGERRNIAVDWSLAAEPGSAIDITNPPSVEIRGVGVTCTYVATEGMRTKFVIEAGQSACKIQVVFTVKFSNGERLIEKSIISVI